MEKDRSDNIALIDLDGTVCDHDGALERDLNLLRSPSEPLINISKWRDKSKMPSHISSRTYMIRDRSCWWRDLPPIKQGMDLVGLKSSYLRGSPERYLTILLQVMIISNWRYPTRV